MVTEEIKEKIYNSYCMSLDLDIALLKEDLTDVEKQEIIEDEQFNIRLRLEKASIKEQIIQSLMHLGFNSINDSVRLSALNKLGELLYKEKFKGTNNTEDHKKPIKVVLEGVSPSGPEDTSNK